MYVCMSVRLIHPLHIQTRSKKGYDWDGILVVVVIVVVDWYPVLFSLKNPPRIMCGTVARNRNSGAGESQFHTHCICISISFRVVNVLFLLCSSELSERFN